MKPRHFWFALTFIAVELIVAPARSAVQSLSSLTRPTLQTLIDLGSDGVSVGDEEFVDFNFVNALPGSGVTAEQIQVEPYSIGGNGLRFVSDWFAANGTIVDEVITFNVKAMDTARPIGAISLLSNGTAPYPVRDTFAADSLVSLLADGTTAGPVLSTYNNGLASKAGAVSPDVNSVQSSLAPQEQLQISDTVYERSAASNGSDHAGVATESLLQNGFTDASLPEPSRSGWVFLPMAALVGTLRQIRMRAVSR